MNTYKFFSALTLISLFTGTLQAEPFMLGSSNADNQRLIVHNRILAKVNGKPITVMDVMKKMDMIFYRQFSEFSGSISARFQFYQANWQYFLQELIDKELILADSAENKMPLTNGDVRQEMETLFGPNIIANLDKAGLTYEDAWNIVKGDIILRRMMYVRVNTKAMKQVTPQQVRDAYEQFAKDNARQEEWHYAVISIRDKDAKTAASAAEKVHNLLEQGKVPMAELQATAENQQLVVKPTLLTVSEEYHHPKNEVSVAYQEVLAQMTPGTYSAPISQKSRADNSTVYRIFYLKEIVSGGIIPLSEVETKIQDLLLDKAVEAEMKVYIERLRKHYDVQESQLKEMIPEDFQPFSLQ